MTLKWIPAHCQIAGNEKADKLAKTGGRLPQSNHPSSYNESKTLIKASWKKARHAKHPTYSYTKDGMHQLPRNAQRAIFRLRTGHVSLRAHLFRIGKAESPACPCGYKEQTVEHILQHCPALETYRAAAWPNTSTLHDKLWGPPDCLHLTHNFLENSGLSI